MRRDQLPPHKTATFVLDRWKVVYISVPKAACTSLKWLVADLQGEDRARFYRSRSREVGRAMCVHMRALWQRTAMLHQLSDEDLAAISPDQGWFVFAVVRHPGARLWSGWQSKFLLREPRYFERYGGTEWFPRIPNSTQDVVEDFQRFVLSIAEDPEQPVMGDRHFWRQTELIASDRTPYSRVYHTSEIPRLLKDLDGHLRGQGWQGQLELATSNETPLKPARCLFTPEVATSVSELYAPDFAEFGYTDPLPDGLKDGDYAQSSLAEIGRLTERAERIGDLALAAQQARGESVALREQLAVQGKQLAEARKRAKAASHPTATTLRRVRRKIMNMFA